MIKIFIMKINAQFALFTWSCLVDIFTQGTPHYPPSHIPFVKGNIFVFAKPALLGEPEGQVGATLYFHLYLQLCIYICIFATVHICIFCKVGSSV